MQNCKNTFAARRRQSRAGFTLVEISVVMGAMITMAVLGISGLNYQRARAAGDNCGVNLRLIQEAKRCALEENPTLTTFTTAQLLPYLPGGTMPKCPGGGTYGNVTSLGATASCTLDTGSANAWHSPRTPGVPPTTVKGGGGKTGGPIIVEPDAVAR